MKRKIITGLILGATIFGGSVLLNSCNDALDIEQPGQVLDENVFVNVANMKSYLNGSIYANIEPSYGNYLTAVLTDEVRPGSGSGGQEYGLHRYFLDNSNTQTGEIWLRNYLVINRVGRFLEGAKKVTPKPGEVAEYNKMLAEARVIRAYSYLELQKYFSTDMKNENALGVMLLPAIVEDPLNVNLPRVSNKVIFDFINADLDFARGMLTYGSDAYYANKTFVAAVAARANLYKGNYPLAKQYAQEAIGNAGFPLTPSNPITIIPTGSTTPLVVDSQAWKTAFYNISNSFNPYRQMWSDINKGESIFSLVRMVPGSGLAVGSFWNTNQSSISGSPLWSWGMKTFGLFNVDDDVRKWAYVDPTSTPGEKVIDKFPGKVGSATRNDIKVIRLSEMYFILAESEVEAGNLTAAATNIQAIRNARFYQNTPATPTYANAQQAYVDILKERRIELALEGHRYIDLKRLAVKAGVTMDRDLIFDDQVATSNLPNGSYKYTLPIPLQEMSANPAMTQNPGY